VGQDRRCPHCGDLDGYVNVVAQSWGFCDRHRVAWYIGQNLTDHWKTEDNRTWDENARFLANTPLIYTVPNVPFDVELAR
jgi:hypothetical protein